VEIDPIADRRQRAREAAADECPSPYVVRDAIHDIEAAIEVATQVKITDDIIDAYYNDFPASASAKERATALLRAAGFEVVE
jgi:hypothetical protein